MKNLNLKQIKHFKEKGYVIVKKFFSSRLCINASKWLHKQDPEKLANTWTEQEPMVPLAVYFAIHNYETPISKLAKNKDLLNCASQLINDEVYIWSSKVNLKAKWCGTAEYYHQDIVYWKDRGYKKHDMLSAMIVLEDHNLKNAALQVFPGSHKLGFVEHEPFININGLAKFMVHPKKLDQYYKKYGLQAIEAKPGDVVFFHASLIHGSSHNISNNGRMIILSQLNSIGNKPKNVTHKSRQFNLSRARQEYKEAKRKLVWFRKKYNQQLNQKTLTFSAPIVKEEK